MNFVYKIISALLIIIIIFYTVESCYKYREGATFTNLDNNKRQTPLSDSNRAIILLEIATSIEKHEKSLGILDEDYHQSTIEVDRNIERMTNIRKLLNIMKKQDNEIQTLLSSYIPSDDLQGLIDGTLLKELGIQLGIATITPIKPEVEVNPIKMKELADVLYSASDTYDSNSMTAMSLSTQGDMYTSNAVKTQYTNSLVNNEIYNPHQLTDSAAQSVLESNYLSNMMNIIQYQDIAINIIASQVSKNILKVYSKEN